MTERREKGAPADRPAPELFRLDERVVLVTGSGGGIGRILALAYAQAGARVALHDRSPELLVDADRLVAGGGGDVRSFVADLAEVAECQRLVRDVVGSFGRLDVLVNCAATNSRLPIDEVDEATFEQIVAVNLRAPYFLSQAVHPVMARQGGGRIINIGSLNNFYGLHGVSVYGMTKAGITQLTKVSAVEWAPDNIQVNCLTPGFIVTPMNEASLWGVPQKRRWMLDRVPAGRPGQPEDLVGAAVFLASDAAAFMTGQTVVIDGGFLAGGSWEYQAREDTSSRP